MVSASATNVFHKDGPHVVPWCTMSRITQHFDCWLLMTTRADLGFTQLRSTRRSDKSRSTADSFPSNRSAETRSKAADTSVQ
eukprot:7608545-Alexandrium_andersonii.AAC.1